MATEDCNDYISDIARTLDEFLKGLSDCGLLATYSVKLQTNVFDISVKQKFRLVVNELMMNLQKLLLSFSIMGEDEITLSIPTKDGFAPIIMKINEAIEDTEEQFPTESDLKLVNEILTETNSDNSNLFSPISEQEMQNTFNVLAGTDEKDIIFDDASFSEQTAVDSVIHMVYSNKEKNEISEPWQLSILKNGEEDVTIDTITEVMTKNHLKDSGWQCDMCSKIFSKMKNLKEHCQNEHDGTGCFECNLCGARVMTKLSLKRHIRSHSGIKEATCDICGKMFKRSDYLTSHYKLHAGARSHKCPTCDKEFVSKTSLKIHEKVHSIEKEFICQECNKSFTRRDKLRDHMLRHLNIKRFQCSVCNKRYAEKRDLRTHLNHH